MDLVLKYLSVYFFSTFKFIVGPTIGATAGLSVHFTAIFTALGMISTTILFSFFDKHIQWLIQRFLSKKKKKTFSKRNRRFVRIWGLYGIPGVAFLTPLLLSPVVGAILVNAFGSDKRKILLYMSISAFFWAYVLTIVLMYFKHLIF